MNQRKNLQKAFTLIELVIVLAVAAIITLIATNSLLNSQAQQMFNNQFEEVLSLVKEARSLGISSKGQIDYTDADKDGCANSGSVPSGATCTIPDYATPANYGINFSYSSSQPIVKLFADLYPPLTNAAGNKGSFEEGTTVAEYQAGKDLILKTINISNDYELRVVKESEFNNPVQLGANSISLFFSPLYADLKFQGVAFMSETPILVIQLKEKEGINRCRQIRIHQMAGIPEVKPCSN